VGRLARMGKLRNVHNILVGKPERKRPLQRPKRRWEDNIRMDRKERVWTGLIWLRLWTSCVLSDEHVNFRDP